MKGKERKIAERQRERVYVCVRGRALQREEVASVVKLAVGET